MKICDKFFTNTSFQRFKWRRWCCVGYPRSSLLHNRRHHSLHLAGWLFLDRYHKRLFKDLVARCQSFYLFLHKTSRHTIFIYTTRRVPLLLSSLLPMGGGPPPWGAEPRFELGPAVQQADALLSEARRTLMSYAALLKISIFRWVSQTYLPRVASRAGSFRRTLRS